MQPFASQACMEDEGLPIGILRVHATWAQWDFKLGEDGEGEVVGCCLAWSVILLIV
jgi:hypothetical protein